MVCRSVFIRQFYLQSFSPFQDLVLNICVAGVRSHNLYDMAQSEPYIELRPISTPETTMPVHHNKGVILDDCGPQDFCRSRRQTISTGDKAPNDDKSKRRTSGPP
ncbi:hypothetical protein EGW08_020375, partial [Elysia chlorotica]